MATEIRKAVKAINSNTIGLNVREPHLLNLAGNLVAELILHICKFKTNTIPKILGAASELPVLKGGQPADLQTV